MKVYIIHYNDVVDYNTEHHDMEAFEKKEDAKKRFDEIVAKAKQELADGGCDDWEVEESDTEYTTWPEGSYGTEHFCVYLSEVEVK